MMIIRLMMIVMIVMLLHLLTLFNVVREFRRRHPAFYGKALRRSCNTDEEEWTRSKKYMKIKKIKKKR
jgi:hypothetical protein